MSSTSVANVITGTNPIQHQQVTSSIQSHAQNQHLPTTSIHMQSIGQIQTITTSQQQQQQQHQHPPQLLPTSMNSNTSSTSSSGNTTVVNTQNITQIQQQQQTTGQGNTKEKCRKFLANLIDLSTREPKPVEKNVRNLIQELVDANVEPEEFCDRLEKLLNASPQPCLIGFLKKSLPLLRQALFTKELVIEGIKPPQQHVIATNHLQHQLPRIQAQIRPINQTTTIGQTQVRMISTAQSGTSSILSGNTLRPIGQTTISRQTVNTAGIRLQTPTGVPRLINTQIRGPLPPSIQQQQQQLSSQPPQLHSNVGQSPNIVQIRTPSLAIQRPATVQIRPANNRRATNIVTGSSITAVRVGQTQIKAVPSSIANMVSLSQPPSLAAISSGGHSTGAMLSSSILSNNSPLSSMGSGLVATTLPTPSLPTVQLPPGVGSTTLDAAKAAAAAADSRGEALAAAAAAAKAAASSEKPLPILTMSSASSNSSIIASSIPSMSSVQNKTIRTIGNAGANKMTIKKKKDPQDKDDKTTTSSNSGIGNSSSFFPQPSISSASTTLFGDDDINDVAAMGGVNLAEESQRILGCTENIGTQIRSCKDEAFLNLSGLLGRFRSRCTELGLEEPSQDTAVLMSHGAQEYIKTIIEKLCVTAEHRQDILKMDPRYEVLHDVRGQVKFLEELDKAEQKRHEEIEREMLLRAAKSRSKIEDPEQAKMKARAKEMQRAEMEELRQRDANMTALQAIGPRKKPKLESDSSSGVGSGTSGAMSSSLVNPPPLRPRIKRVNMRDMIFFMEQEKEFMHSELLFKAYLK